MLQAINAIYSNKSPLEEKEQTKAMRRKLGGKPRKGSTDEFIRLLKDLGGKARARDMIPHYCMSEFTFYNSAEYLRDNGVIIIEKIKGKGGINNYYSIVE